jgi:hypothetical protein
LTLRTNVEHPIELKQKPMVIQLENGEYEVRKLLLYSPLFIKTGPD